MIRQVLAVAAGFIVWSAGWLGYNAALRNFALLPNDQTRPIQSVGAVGALLIGSWVLSLLAGFVAASVANFSSAVWLGLLLLAVGLLFQIQLWRLLPLWYHIPFLALLMPLCLAGAWLRRAMT